ncbi:hypothetical protein [uncultured Jatrophihabitans sp.]|uniref:hypothetical protein n=1 Tax=uncultured Jatrophihabitans sp. TaxID=1610747 RepID=UPI0035CACC37
MIGYYVHHHGTGHLSRAQALAAACTEPVVVLSSLPEPADKAPFAGWVRLPGDPHLPDAADPQAGGALHWSPLRSGGYRARMHCIVEWLATARPRTVVVDVSVEVTALVRLTGVPVVAVALPGERADDAHALGHRLASRIVAPWPAQVLDAAHLRPYADKTVYTGAFSRFDDRAPADVHAPAGDLLLLLGSGGAEVTLDRVAELERVTGRECRVLGEGFGWSDDVWADLCAAQVVLTHGGLGALGEVAAARRPCVVLPQPRPFAEQELTAAALQRAGLATVCTRWPDADAWPGVLADAAAGDGQRWRAWNDGRGMARMVDAVCAPLPGEPVLDRR